MVRLHFIGLESADRGFERKQMLAFHTSCFGKHLTPSILACALDPQHRQTGRIKFGVMVLGATRKQEIWPGFSLCNGATFVVKSIFGKDYLKMVFKRPTDPSFSSVLHRERELKKTVDVPGESFCEPIPKDVFF